MGMVTEFCLLGPLTVRRGGVTLPVVGKHRECWRPAGVDCTGGPVSSANPDTPARSSATRDPGTGDWRPHIKEWGGPFEEGRQRCHPAGVPAV
jgi:hypothetical protein